MSVSGSSDDEPGIGDIDIDPRDPDAYWEVVAAWGDAAAGNRF